MPRIVVVFSIVVALTGSIFVGRASLDSEASEAPPADLAGHPLLGNWLAMANPLVPGDPPVPTPSIFAADGSVVLAFAVSQAGPQGVTFQSAALGTWEPDGERTGHFTAVQVLSDANGAFLGTVTIDGHPTVSEDGQSFVDDAPETTVTIRDPAGAVMTVIPGDSSPPVRGSRMGVGSPGFPAGTPSAGTPTTAAPSAPEAQLIRATKHERLLASGGSCGCR